MNLTPKLSLDELIYLGKHKCLPNGVPVAGHVALRLIRDETLYHADLEQNRTQEALDRANNMRATLQQQRVKSTLTAQQIADQELADLDQGNELVEELNKIQSEELPTQPALAEARLNRQRQIIDELKEIQQRRLGRLQEVDAAIDDAAGEIKSLDRCRNALDNLKRRHGPIKAKVLIAFFGAFVTGFIISLFAVALQLLAAYETSLRLEPQLKALMSVELTVLVVFLIGFAVLTPLINWFIESLYWLIYRGRLDELIVMLGAMEMARNEFEQLVERVTQAHSRP